MTDGLDQFRRCLICGSAPDRECNGGPDAFCGPFALYAPPVDPPATWPTTYVGLGVPPYTPTEAQPTRVGGTEA